MKKSLLVVATIIIFFVLIAGALYWYWQSQPEEVEPLQQVALDNSDTKSFDDVCTRKDEYELECKGNIEAFDCEQYRSTENSFADLQPSYPMLICEKKTSSIDGVRSDEGVYRQNAPTAYDYLDTNVVDYLIIREGLFQLIQSEDQLRQLFQPIESAEEAIAYFKALHKAFLILKNEQLSGFKYLEEIGDEKGTFYIPSDSIGLSEIQKTWHGYNIVAYSSYGGRCVDEIYQYKYLLKEDGHLIEKNKKLIWESKSKPACIN